jgi:hypothetical protein
MHVTAPCWPSRGSWPPFLLARWVEQWNAWVQPHSDAKGSGLRKGQGFCAKISQQGGVRFKTNPGAFKGKYKVRALEL